MTESAGDRARVAPGAHPCRLFVFLARDAPLGLVLRRGPSDWFRLSLWRTDTDALEHGQWLRGRVYERRTKYTKSDPSGARSERRS